MLLDNASPHCTIASRILIAGVLTDVPGYLKKSKKPQNQLTSFCEIIRPVSGGGGREGPGAGLQASTEKSSSGKTTKNSVP